MNWGQAIGAAFTESSTLVAVFVALMFLAAAVAGVRAYRRPYELVARPAPLGADTGLLPESRIVGQLEQALLFALAGYLFFDRAFAWIHVPGLPLFVGELVIVLGIVALLSTNMRLGGAVRGSSCA